MFFTYRQNNTFGKLIHNDSVDVYVIVEANDARHADAVAQINTDIYFDGCSAKRDCPCCGDRWSRQYGEGDEVPSIYRKPITDIDASLPTSRTHRARFDALDVVIYTLDGRRRYASSEQSPIR